MILICYFCIEQLLIINENFIFLNPESEATIKLPFLKLLYIKKN